jgi:hypothetical protein
LSNSFIAGVIYTSKQLIASLSVNTEELIAKVKLQIYPLIVLIIWNGLVGILRDPGETDSWKNQKSQILCQTPFNNRNAFRTTQYTVGPMWPMCNAKKLHNLGRIKNWKLGYGHRLCVLLGDWISQVPKFVDRIFVKTSPKRSYSVIENKCIELVFAKTVSYILSKIITAPQMGPKITWEREIQKQKIETLIFGHFKNVV